MSLLYHRSVAEVRRQKRNQVIVMVLFAVGFLTALYFISEDLASRGF